MNRMTRSFLVAGALLGAAVLAPVRAQEAPQVGLFFDTQGNNCTATLEPFLPIQAHILAFVEPGVELGGAFLRLELPLDINIDQIRWPKDTDPQGSLTSSFGLDLTFLVCPTTDGQPVTLASFMITDVSFGDPRPDIEIRVLGGTITAPDTLKLTEPNLKVCDPDDPEGYSDLIVAPATRATMNCSSGDCPCNETAVRQHTWTAVRKLYAND